MGRSEGGGGKVHRRWRMKLDGIFESREGSGFEN
jgi:hypothetical protein